MLFSLHFNDTNVSFKSIQQAYIINVRSKGIKQKTLPALEAGTCPTKAPVMPVAN